MCGRSGALIRLRAEEKRREAHDVRRGIDAKSESNRNEGDAIGNRLTTLHYLAEGTNCNARMQVTVYGPLRSATGKKTVMLNFEGGTVKDALDAFVENYPRTKSQLYDENEAARSSVRVSVNGERANLDDECPSDAELTVFPAVQGGTKS